MALQFHLLQDLAELQKANAKLQLAKEQSMWDVAVYKAKYDKAVTDKMGAQEENLIKHAENVKVRGWLAGGLDDSVVSADAAVGISST